ncbi:hypothetical protein SERLA73DRAFT_191290 [Serpula lacrymans var. lacrymans S7.3]|uniref:Uncharacterized protein n=2 Tax=Serpula lacrymans var. lacrymans TaxID=341189 RepID=F8QH85_SERL3|nr:uncharacterized protein SERLADRAFT_459908 [Serpula lacrymans var. lacrymans S7.9]EGN92334.1 hypothetical protein SERLA73DRAFT_191290 [Serpula lacrymans var. lacrymans S7.3]EGO27085.1 hypothetical protein SERLADRAFT_459908 [Serpula lacrymans var. lacrymans S7.9]
MYQTNGAKYFDESRISARLIVEPNQGVGYYPLRLGQQLDGSKLEITRKLRWGSYFSTLLARSLCRNGLGPTLLDEDTYPSPYAAVNIVTANASSGAVNASLAEMDALRAIKITNPSHPCWKHYHCLHRFFIVKGSH